MCSLRAPARTRGGVVSGFLFFLALTPCGLTRAQEDPGDQDTWAPDRNAVSIGLHSFLEDGESGGRVGIWWAVSNRVNLGVTWRDWDNYEVFEPEVRLYGNRQRSVTPFLSVSGIRQLHGEMRSTGLGVGLGIEGYPRKGLGLSAALGGRTIWREWESGGNDGGDLGRTSWFRLNAGALVFPLDLFRTSGSQAQSIPRGRRHFQVSGGPGISFSGDRRDGEGYGAGILIEAVEKWTGWFSGRLYGGGFLSSADTSSCPAGVQPCSVSSQIAVAGAKARLLFPTPYVGPFVELGVGLSAGSIETRVDAVGSSPALEESHSGLMVHFPVSVGIAFGAEYQHDISFDYFIHRGREHVVGVFALGIGFVLGRD